MNVLTGFCVYFPEYLTNYVCSRCSKLCVRQSALKVDIKIFSGAGSVLTGGERTAGHNILQHHKCFIEVALIINNQHDDNEERILLFVSI